MVFRLVIACRLLSAQFAAAKGLEPHRWARLPIGASFIGVACSCLYTEFLFDSALKIEYASGDTHNPLLACPLMWGG